jgi:hypothetical protein
MAEKSLKKPLRSQTRATIAPPENIEEGDVENQEISNNPEIQEEIISPPTPEPSLGMSEPELLLTGLVHIKPPSTATTG